MFGRLHVMRAGPGPEIQNGTCEGLRVYFWWVPIRGCHVVLCGASGRACRPLGVVALVFVRSFVAWFIGHDLAECMRCR